MRQEVKKYIETADFKVVRMLHAMLEVYSENNWWDSMPNNIKKNVETALLESKNGNVTSNEEIKKRYQKI